MSRIPASGGLGRIRRRKEELDGQLDEVDGKLGTVRKRMKDLGMFWVGCCVIRVWFFVVWVCEGCWVWIYIIIIRHSGLVSVDGDLMVGCWEEVLGMKGEVVKDYWHLNKFWKGGDGMHGGCRSTGMIMQMVIAADNFFVAILANQKKNRRSVSFSANRWTACVNETPNQWFKPNMFRTTLFIWSSTKLTKHSCDQKHLPFILSCCDYHRALSGEDGKKHWSVIWSHRMAPGGRICQSSMVNGPWMPVSFAPHKRIDIFSTSSKLELWLRLNGYVGCTVLSLLFRQR